MHVHFFSGVIPGYDGSSMSGDNYSNFLPVVLLSCHWINSAKAQRRSSNSVIRLHRMHRQQRCGLLLPMFRGLHVCLLVTSMSWTDWDDVLVVNSGGPKKPCIRWRPGSLWGRGSYGAVSPLKCISLDKQQTPQQHGAADLSTGRVHHGKKVASKWTHYHGGDKFGVVRPFINILWPLVII